MEIYLDKKSFYFFGTSGEFRIWLNSFPADWTVKELIQYHLN